MSGAIAGKNATIEIYEEGPPITWTPLSEIKNIGDMTLKAGVYDVTSHGPSLYREIKPGLYEISDLSMECNYIDDAVQQQYQTFFTKFLNSTLASYRLRWPDDTAHTFEAYVTDITPTTPLDDVIKYNLTLTISGIVVYSIIE